MKKILDIFSGMSWGRVVLMGGLVVGLVVLPAGIYLANRGGTRLVSRAAIEQERRELRPRGPRLTKVPQVDGVFPFAGKVGDEVVIIGEGLGEFPQDGVVEVGGVRVPEEEIVSWKDTAVVVRIPAVAVSGEVLVGDPGVGTARAGVVTVYQGSEDRYLTRYGSRIRVEDGRGEMLENLRVRVELMNTEVVEGMGEVTIDESEVKNVVVLDPTQAGASSRAGGLVDFVVEPGVFW